MAISNGGTRRHGGKTLGSNEALSREISCHYAARRHGHLARGCVLV